MSLRQQQSDFHHRWHPATTTGVFVLHRRGGPPIPVLVGICLAGQFLLWASLAAVALAFVHRPSCLAVRFDGNLFNCLRFRIGGGRAPIKCSHFHPPSEDFATGQK